MQFQVLSHAGLLVTSGGASVLFDPWLVGSAYWRSWWNYPPVAPALVASLKPDFIYLTHIHWDHFHGVTLRRFDHATPVIVPRAVHPRMKDDLHAFGFRNVIELGHGEGFDVAPDFRLTSYHSLFLDSAVVVEAEGTTLFNANDCKLMGLPLQQVIRRHPHIDFVLRSHSAANARLCYETIGRPAEQQDDPRHYLRDFTRFACATRARYAVPFASNHCFLHDDSFHYNETITTPRQVEEYFERCSAPTPELRPMVSGDSWSSDGGFSMAGDDWFDKRDEHLAALRIAAQPQLARHAAVERRARVEVADLERYFQPFSRALPALVRRWFRGFPVGWVASAGDTRYAFEVDIAAGGRARVLDAVTDETHAIQVHTSAYILKRCLTASLFSHLPVSKRVRFRTTTAGGRRMKLLNSLLSVHESGMLPLRNNLRLRSLREWLPRWRELLLYAQLLLEYVVTRRIDLDRYLPGHRLEGDARHLKDILPG